MENDTLIRDHVREELDFDPSVHAEGIGVSVAHSVVTLAGHVPSYADKFAAFRAAQRVKGVKAVASDLVVRLPQQKKRNDDEIAERALKILNWTLDNPATIKVVVDGGCVTLTGQVDWRYQREQAERAIRLLGGVVQVSNMLTLRPRIEPSRVREGIERAFARNATLEGAGILVRVDGSAVTLSGKVKAWYERKMAEDAAWAVPGVTAVHDNIALI